MWMRMWSWRGLKKRRYYETCVEEEEVEVVEVVEMRMLRYEYRRL
jgi:hypothetical protein